MKNIIKITFFLSLFVISSNGFSQKSQPSSFQDIKLGMSYDEFIKNNPNYWNEPTLVFPSNISDEGMIIRLVNKETSSGMKVNVRVAFYEDKIAIIYIKYEMSKDELLKKLISKYGKFNSSKVIKSPFAGGELKFISYSWTSFPCCKLSLSYNENFGQGSVIYADASVQKKIKYAAPNNKSNSID